jgi:hypothetical protein
MSEGIHILEGGLTRKISPVDKIKTDTTDGNGALWVPNSKAVTGVLHASENGIYIASEDGYEAYSEVIVRVTKDSFDGDTSFEDWDYETPDMDLDNWDPETIEDFETDPEAFDDVFNNEDEWKDINKPIDTKFKDDKISGIDPISGNPMEVGLDENGFLTEKTLPSAIKIEVPPTKTEYSEGDTIDFTGIKVFLLDANGEHFTSEEYPTGEIPFEELMFPVTIVEGSGEEGTIRTDGEGINVIELHGFIEEDPNNPDRIWVSYGTIGGKHIITTNPVIGAILYFTRYGASIYSATNKDNLGTLSIRYDGGSMATVAPSSLNNLVRTYAATEQFSFVPESTSDPENINPESLPSESGTDIPVQWIRSDGEILEDNFSITIQSDSQI